MEDSRRERERKQEEENFNRELAEEQQGRQNVYNALSRIRDKKQAYADEQEAQLNEEIAEIDNGRQSFVNTLNNYKNKREQIENKAPAKAVEIAAAPVAENKSERKKQARAISVVANANEVEIPTPVKKSLVEGGAKAIEKSQEILRNNGALPPIEGIKGRDAEVLTDSGKSNIKTQYRVVEADDLIDSDSVNYPQ